ncbi:hypothetical protein [Morganella morganii]|uniref:hypothetical protein n=1 Tax=Morganella morganii TaxID=582 RepID=UPI000F6C8A86|nr:MAG: hypothetical protein [Phage NG54]HCU0869413.1 hypothetical protein [Morganella morganii]HCU0900243.1 hypothetical protein [Morganella morganii]
MKYIVSQSATLSLPDGTRFELTAGIHDGEDFPGPVVEHWAFPSYARPLDEADIQKEKDSRDMSAKVITLETELTELKAALAEKDGVIDGLNTELTELKAALAKQDKKQGAGDGKKQSSSDN